MSWLSTEFFFYKGSPPCRAVWMTLKYMKVDFEEKPLDLLKLENKRPWFVRLNPQHKVPVLQSGNFVLCESRAIMQYLCNKYCTEENQHLYPLEPEARGMIDRMMYFDMGTLYYSIREYFGPRVLKGLDLEPEKENLLKTSLEHLDYFLDNNGTPFFCGEQLTLADIAILASISQLEAMDYSYKCYGELLRWSQRAKEAVKCYKECCDEGIEMTKANTKVLVEETKKEMAKQEEQERKLCFIKK